MQASGSGSPAPPETSRRVVTARTPEPTRARPGTAGWECGVPGRPPLRPPARQAVGSARRSWGAPAAHPAPLPRTRAEPAGRTRASRAAGSLARGRRGRLRVRCCPALPGLGWRPALRARLVSLAGPSRRALHLPAGVRSASSLILGGRTSGNWCHLFDGPEVFRKAVNRVSVLLRGSRNVFLGGCSVRFWSCWLINQQFHSSASWIGPCCAAGALPCFPHRPDKCRTRGDGRAQASRRVAASTLPLTARWALLPCGLPSLGDGGPLSFGLGSLVARHCASLCPTVTTK